MVTIVEHSTADDWGDWIAIVDGVTLPGRYWRREGAEAAADDYLWRHMVLG